MVWYSWVQIESLKCNFMYVATVIVDEEISYENLNISTFVREVPYEGIQRSIPYLIIMFNVPTHGLNS